MKNLFKNNIRVIVAFVLGLLVAGSVGVYAYVISASDVSYDNSTSGLTGDNVKDALDDLYTKLGNISGSIDLEDGKYVLAYDDSSIHRDLPTAYNSNFYINESSIALCNVTSYTTLNARGYNIRIIGIRKDGTIDQYAQPSLADGPIYDITDYSYIILWSLASAEWGAYPWVTK